LPGFGKSTPPGGVIEPIPALQDVDCINQYGEHQALLGAQAFPTHAVEELARQNDVAEAERIGLCDVVLRSIGQFKIPFYALIWLMTNIFSQSGYIISNALLQVSLRCKS
jgi:hypothetical protein